MHRKFWFLVAAAVAVFALTGTAAATGGSHLSQFQKAWASVKWTPQARAQSGQVNFGMEQSISGFNGLDSDETLFWAVVTGETPVLRGNYIVDNNRVYHLDAASAVTSTQTHLTITIKAAAQWAIEGGITSPMVAQDYAFTYNVIMDSNNPVASTTGYKNIKPGGSGISYTMPGGPNGKTIIFNWGPKPFADWHDLFGFILPNFALPNATQLGANNGQAFNEIWRNCVCVEEYDSGSGDVIDHLGQQVSNGPFFVDAYNPATGLIDKPNNTWFGPNAQLSQVNFVRTTPGNTEAAGLTGGQLDAAFPAPTAAYVGIRSNPAFVYQAKKGFVQEHQDFNQANPLLAHNWMRQAYSLGINRPALIKAVYYDSNIVPTGTMGQLNSPEYVLGKYSLAPYDYFKTWNFNQTRALNIMALHCTGGPTNPSPANTKIWQCPDGPASFEWWSTTLPTRVQSGAIYQAQLKQIGIDLVLHNTGGGNLFGNILPGAQTNSCVTNTPCGADTYDVAEYAFVGGVDPSGFNAIYECFDNAGNGGQNYKNYCAPTIGLQQTAGDSDLSATRYLHYLKVASIVSNKVFIDPLYARPQILIYRTSVGGGMALANNPTSVGPSWNMENWTN